MEHLAHPTHMMVKRIKNQAIHSLEVVLQPCTIYKAKIKDPVIYSNLKQTTLPTGNLEWNASLNIEPDWKEIFINTKSVTGDIKLRWFQMQINHRILATN